MTLIVNEIYHDPKDPSRSRIFAAADRRISKLGSPAGEKRKLFLVERLNATISYFGLAQAQAGEYFEDLIPRFIGAHQSASIRQLAVDLRDFMTRNVPRAWLSGNASGFHVCGFTPDGVPQMWYISNIGGMDGFAHVGLTEEYAYAAEQLALPHHLGPLYDSVTGTYSRGFAYSFQNGDLRSFHDAWPLLDNFAQRMDAVGLTNTPTTPTEHEARLKWKMMTIALFYENVSFQRIIGGDIDTYILLPEI